MDHDESAHPSPRPQVTKKLSRRNVEEESPSKRELVDELTRLNVE